MKKKPLYKIDPDSEVKASGLGYIYVTTTPDYKYGKKMQDHDKTYVYKHIVVVENSLGKSLPRDKNGKLLVVIHHLDQDPTNNHLSNLEVTTQPEHARDHEKTHKFWKKSPLNKPGKTRARKVASRYLELTP